MNAASCSARPITARMGWRSVSDWKLDFAGISGIIFAL
jgi:hypothetical protein